MAKLNWGAALQTLGQGLGGMAQQDYQRKLMAYQREQELADEARQNTEWRDRQAYLDGLKFRLGPDQQPMPGGLAGIPGAQGVPAPRIDANPEWMKPYYGMTPSDAYDVSRLAPKPADDADSVYGYYVMGDGGEMVPGDTSYAKPTYGTHDPVGIADDGKMIWRRKPYASGYGGGGAPRPADLFGNTTVTAGEGVSRGLGSSVPPELASLYPGIGVLSENIYNRLIGSGLEPGQALADEAVSRAIQSGELNPVIAPDRYDPTTGMMFDDRYYEPVADTSFGLWTGVDPGIEPKQGVTKKDIKKAIESGDTIEPMALADWYNANLKKHVDAGYIPRKTLEKLAAELNVPMSSLDPLISAGKRASDAADVDDTGF